MYFAEKMFLYRTSLKLLKFRKDNSYFVKNFRKKPFVTNLGNSRAKLKRKGELAVLVMERATFAKFFSVCKGNILEGGYCAHPDHRRRKSLVRASV